MGISIKWDITYKCNLNCEHCINGNLLNNNTKEISLDDVKDIINKIGSSSIDYIHLLGGEPTARKDIVEICEFFNESNIKFGFNTNGINIMTEKMRPLLLNKSLINSIFSIEGPTKEINDSIRGKNVFDLVVKNIKEMVDLKKENNLNNCKISINTVVSKYNYEYIIDMIDFCIDLGVDELNLLQMIAEGNAKDKDILISNEDELNLVEKIANKYTHVKDKLQINTKFTRPIAKDYCEQVLGLEYPLWIHSCGAGTEFMFIDNKGNISPCDRFKNIKDSNLLNYKFNNIWGRKEFGKAFEMTEGHSFYKKLTPCNKCKHLRVSCYPCVAIVENTVSHNVSTCNKYFELLEKVGKNE